MCGSVIDSQSAITENRRGTRRTRMWAYAQRDGRPRNIRGALSSESSVIPFRVPRHKVWLTPTARVPCSNAVNIGERKT